MELLQKLTGKKHIYLVNRGNTAIKLALKIAGRDKILIQDQGGWITYKQYAKNHVLVKTDYGVLDLDDLKSKADADSVLLINSLSGYFVKQPMEKIMEICKSKNCLVINDISGSIGTLPSKFGDIIIGSFGRWKPINLEYGGFIASDEKLEIGENFDKNHLKDLENKLIDLPLRLNKLYSIVKKIKDDLSKFEIIYPEDSLALVVVIKYKNDEEKSEIIKYCCDNKYEYTLCPRYIRVDEEAISIEVKRG